jgi:glycosyltransferase involved in cell wall biosynthesis
LYCPANIAPIFVPKSKKLVISIHDVAFLTFPESFSKPFRLYYKLIIPINIKRADKIITVSNYSKNEIEKYYPNSIGKIEIIYNGYNNQFKNIKTTKKDQILYVGSMNERKNFIGTLKAFEVLKENKYELLMVGNFNLNFIIGEEAKAVLKNAKNNSKIKFLHNISNKELINIYNESKLFIFPSLYEGFGFPVLEAMACGTPVVCSKSSSLPEVGGDAVVYCDPYNIKDIKEKIKLVVEDENLQNKMIQKGLKRAQVFSWEKSTEEHIKVFEEVLKS